VDPTFDPGSGVNKNGTATVNAILVQPDSQILIGGDFTTYNGVARAGIARLNTNGSLDTSFHPGPGANAQVLAVALQPDGKVLIAGSFTNVNGVLRNRIARLNSNGTLDTSFDPGAGPDYDVNTTALQPDGKILIGGGFGGVAGVTRNALARLNPNGSLDEAFVPNLASDSFVDCVLVQSNKVVLSGIFQTPPSPAVDQVIRLNPDGSVDNAFQQATANGEILSLLSQPDGEIIGFGSFTTVNGASRSHVARLNNNGSLDSTFVPGAGPNGDVLAAGLQSNGKIVIGGNFVNVDGAGKNGVARLNADGTLDPVYNTGSGVQGSLQALALQPDGRAVIGGFISAVDGLARNGIARLQGDVSVVPLTAPQWTSSGGFSVAVATTPGSNYVLQYVNNLGDTWTSLPAVAGDGSVKVLTDPSATSAPHRFYRVRVQ
jgi:uncharacterized delta-60 repeat protein